MPLRRGAAVPLLQIEERRRSRAVQAQFWIRSSKSHAPSREGLMANRPTLHSREAIMRGSRG